MKFYPFGDRRNSQGNLGTDKLFTGQRLDGTGLYYYGARYYDPGIGRFVSADSIVLATGWVPESGLLTELEGKVPALYAVGDCTTPRHIAEAME